MNQEAPQLPRSEEHTWYHPSNLAVTVINGIARLEHWRQSQPDRTAMDERTQTIRDRTEAAQQQERMMRSLTFKAARNPEFQPELFEAQRSYHTERASILGERALQFEGKSSPFSRLRQIYNEKKHSYHQSKARKAARSILQLQSK